MRGVVLNGSVVHSARTVGGGAGCLSPRPEGAEARIHSPLNRAVNVPPDIAPIATRDSTVGGTGAMPGKNVSKTRFAGTPYGRRNIGYGRRG